MNLLPSSLGCYDNLFNLWITFLTVYQSLARNSVSALRSPRLTSLKLASHSLLVSFRLVRSTSFESRFWKLCNSDLWYVTLKWRWMFYEDVESFTSLVELVNRQTIIRGNALSLSVGGGKSENHVSVSLTSGAFAWTGNALDQLAGIRWHSLDTSIFSNRCERRRKNERRVPVPSGKPAISVGQTEIRTRAWPRI